MQTDGIIDTVVFLLEVLQCMAPGWVHVPARGLPRNIKPISAFYVQTTAIASLRMMCNASCLELEAALCANQAVKVGLRASYLLLLMLAWHFVTRCSSFGLLECIKRCSVLEPTRSAGGISRMNNQKVGFGDAGVGTHNWQQRI